MLRIHHAEDDTRAPGKAYADAIWAAQPRLSPTWWREMQGHTVGKLAMDWREGIFDADKLAAGCNMVVTSPGLWPQVREVMARQAEPAAMAGVLVVERVAEIMAPSPAYVVWQPGAEDAQVALTALEARVKDGTLVSYGVMLDGSRPLHLWLEDAATAAQMAWGRRKRPGLRMVMLALDMLDLGAMTELTERHKEEPVSTLELAARLGLSVIVTEPLLPGGQPAAQSLAALVRVAEAEAALNQELGGWPEVGGQRMFSVLAHLSQGQTPWATPGHWRGWLRHVWPEMQAVWQRMDVQGAAVEDYFSAMKQMLPHGVALAQAAAQSVLAHMVAVWRARVPDAWREADDTALVLGLTASLPGVTVMAMNQPFETQPLMLRDEVADMGRVLLGS